MQTLQNLIPTKINSFKVYVYPSFLSRHLVINCKKMSFFLNIFPISFAISQPLKQVLPDQGRF